MKKLALAAAVLLMLLSVCGCKTQDVGIIGGADGPTQIIVK